MQAVLLTMLSAIFDCGCRLAFSAALQLHPGSSNQSMGVLGISELHTTLTMTVDIRLSSWQTLCLLLQIPV